MELINDLSQGLLNQSFAPCKKENFWSSGPGFPINVEYKKNWLYCTSITYQ